MEIKKRRVVTLCLDGLDPRLCARWMEAGLLPTFARLREQGTFSPLRTTNPPETAAAWAAFATGQNPGKTGVFDFVLRDPKTYSPLPGLVTLVPRKPGEPARFKNARHGNPVWKILGEHDRRATVLNLPVTWPPEPFNGQLLSGMGAPDIAGTLGLATHYSTAHPASQVKMRGRDEKIVVQIEDPRQGDGVVETVLHGSGESTIPLRFCRVPGSDRLTVAWPDGQVELAPHQFSDWYTVRFAADEMEAWGLCRFGLLELAPNLRVYAAPVMNHPGRPHLPITWPPTFAQELYQGLGNYRTLGREVDIFALLENVLDEDILLRDTFAALAEREQMTRYVLDRYDSDLLISWFGVVDTTQHGYWAFTDPGHPLYTEEGRRRYGDAIQHVYQWLDNMVGRLLADLDEDILLLIASDHGCVNWRRSVHFNTWLWREGYLVFKELSTGVYGQAPTIAGELAVPLTLVDWSRSRAYSVGCGKIYLNLQGREGQGIVAPGAEAAALEAELTARLLAWRDPATGGPVVRNVYRSRDVQWGPQMHRAPDLIVGLHDGYRVSWSSLAQISLGEPVVDNLSKLGGDHISVDHELVPGTLMANVRLNVGDSTPHILDVTPTVLDCFGLAAPTDLDGRSLWPH